MKSGELITLLQAVPPDTEVLMGVPSGDTSGFYAETLSLTSASVRIMRRRPTTGDDIWWDPRPLSRPFSLQPDDVLAVVL